MYLLLYNLLTAHTSLCIGSLFLAQANNLPLENPYTLCHLREVILDLTRALLAEGQGRLRISKSSPGQRSAGISPSPKSSIGWQERFPS